MIVLDVVALVVTYNSADDLDAFFASTRAAFAGVDRWAVVVADNASSDGSAAIALRLGAQVVETGANVGYAAGLNAARAAAPAAAAYFVLNPDLVLGSGCARRLLDALGRPGVGIVVPRILAPDGSVRHSLRREPTVLRALGEALLGGDRAGRVGALGEVVIVPTRYEVAGPADWATGAALLVSAPCWDAVGGWDERFFLYSEETDFARRARGAGFALEYEPTATVVHAEGEAHTSERLAALAAVNRVRYFRKHHGRIHAAAYWCAIVWNEAIRAALGRSTSRAALRALLRRPLLADPAR